VIVVYRSTKSTGAVRLVNALNTLGGNALRVKKLSSIPPTASLIVNWGGCVSPHAAGVWLNKTLVGNKYIEQVKLAKAGIPGIPVSMAPQSGWLARKFTHKGGNDLVAGLVSGDYYVPKLPVVDEYRIHSFNGRSIRLIHKEPGPHAHPWIRSHELGWVFSQIGEWKTTLPKGVRYLAHAAVKALELDFGAVDIGVLDGGGLVVFEVNTAPGLTGSTPVAYATALMEMYEDC
jgi:hypothetical protein